MSSLANKQTNKKTKEFEEKKFMVGFSGKKEGKNSEKMWEIVEFRKKISKWTGLFSVNGLGLNSCGIFEEKKLSFGFRKNRQQPKAVKRLVKLGNLARN